ncbi:MAG TPA: hypothetical protein VF155_08505 [Candidatus Dormibacteraeota bacterium]
MTLALTVVSRHGIWQSSDIRLYDAVAQKPARDRSTKQFRLELQDGVALATYAGVGRLGTTHVSDLIVDLLRGQQRTIHGTLAALAAVANDRIAPVLRGLPPKYRMHVFVLGAFRQGAPLLGEVRNVDVIRQTAAQTWVTPRSDFTVSITPIGDREGIASIAGMRSSVPPGGLALLNRLSARKPRKNEDRLAVLASINEWTSRIAPELVSRECWTWHATGRWEKRPEEPRAFAWGGNMPTSSRPRVLTHGLDFHAMMESMSQFMKSTQAKFGEPDYVAGMSEASRRGLELARRLEPGLHIHDEATGRRGIVTLDPVPGGEVNDIGIGWDSNPTTTEIVNRASIVVDY